MKITTQQMFTKTCSILLLCLPLFSLQATAQEISTRIIGGGDAVQYELPTIVSLKYSNDIYARQFFCAGSLINKDWVVTAAHCLLDQGEILEKERFVLTISDYDLTETLDEYSASRIVIHPDYDNNTNENDIALIKLSKSSNVPPILISSVSQNTKTKNATIWGWGSLDVTGNHYPDILQKAELDVLVNTECSLKLGSSFIGSSMLCAGIENGGIDSCYGDSGGPIIVNDQLVGITSWGIDCAHAQYPGAYTRIETFQPWITSIITNTPIKDPNTGGSAFGFGVFFLLPLIFIRRIYKFK